MDKNKDREIGSAEKGRLPMNTPPVVSAQEWEVALQQLVVKEKEGCCVLGYLVSTCRGSIVELAWNVVPCCDIPCE